MENEIAKGSWVKLKKGVERIFLRSFPDKKYRQYRMKRQNQSSHSTVNLNYIDDVNVCILLKEIMFLFNYEDLCKFLLFQTLIFIAVCTAYIHSLGATCREIRRLALSFQARREREPRSLILYRIRKHWQSILSGTESAKLIITLRAFQSEQLCRSFQTFYAFLGAQVFWSHPLEFFSASIPSVP